MLTGSMVLIWTLGAEDERSRPPNWLHLSSSLFRKLAGMGIDLEGDTVVWYIDLKKWGVTSGGRQQTGIKIISEILALFKSQSCSRTDIKLSSSTYPVESDGGRDGQSSEMGVVPSEDTSSWLNGWCSKNFETSNKLQSTHISIKPLLRFAHDAIQIYIS